MTQIFRNGQLSHDGDQDDGINVHVATTFCRNPWFSSFIIGSNPPSRNHNLWNIISIERYIPHIQVFLECGCQFQCGCQGMKLNGIDVITQSLNLELFSDRTSSRQNIIQFPFLALKEMICSHCSLLPTLDKKVFETMPYT